MNISPIDYNLYKPFLATYEHKNIARAGEQLLITASAVGMRIKELERQLGVKLFIAHARGVTPTKEADELYIKINSAFSVINNAQTSIKEFTEQSIGTIRVGCPSNIASTLLLNFICDFILKYPNIKLEILNKHRSELCEMLAKRDIDVVINKMPIANLNRFIVETLCPLPKSFFASKVFLQKHKLGTVLTKAKLETLPLMLGGKTRENAQYILDVLQKSTNSFIEIAGGNDLIYSLIKRGIGIGYVNDCCVDHNDIVKLTITDVELPKYSLGVAYNKDEQAKLVKVFLQALKSYCNN